MPLEVSWSTTPKSHLVSSHPRLALVHTSNRHVRGSGLAAFEEALRVRGGDPCGSTRVSGHVTRGGVTQEEDV